MKKIFFALLICRAIFIPSESFSQSYVPFPENEAIWTLFYSYGPDNSQNRYYIFHANGDTIINGISYNKLYRKETTQTAILAMDTALGGPNYFLTPGTETVPNTYFLAYRNDVALKTVYKVMPDSTTEKIWYNFNFNIGDTLPNYMVNPDNGTDTLVISEIDSVFICGQQHIQYTVSPTPCYWGSPFIIIQGIGNNQDFTVAGCSMGEYFGTSLYCFVDYDHCGPSDPYTPCNATVNIEENENNFIPIYPNPVLNIIKLPSEFDQVKITNSTGQICKTVQFTSSINVDELPAGLYILSAILDGKNYCTRFVKQ